MTDVPLLPGVGHEQYNQTALNSEVSVLREGDTPLTEFHERTLEVGDELFRGKAFLDVGCGGGWLLTRAIEHGATVVAGVEPSQLVDTAQQRLKNTGAYLEKTTFEAFEIDGKFDLISFVMSTEHMPDLPGVLAKAAGLLKDDGKIVIIASDVTSFTMPRFDYTVQTENSIPGKEYKVATHRPTGYGDTVDLVRTVTYWSECAERAGLEVHEQRPVFADEAFTHADGWQQFALFAQSAENQTPLFQYFCMTKATYF